jgi:uncharacterized protein
MRQPARSGVRWAARLSVLATLALVLLAGAALAAPKFPPLTGRVVDQASLLDSAAEARITNKLAALEQKTGTQLVVVTLASLDGYDIADYGYQLGRAWGIGQKGKNNGVLLIVAPKERKVRIEVGYGMEGKLTVLQSNLIIRNDILPRFRAGDFPGGIERGVDDLVQVLSGGPLKVDRSHDRGEGQSGGFDFGSFLFIALILGFWALRFFGGGGFGPGRRSGMYFPMGGGWGGGGRGFGGGGGFGGFGGGSGGGGGASGSW